MSSARIQVSSDGPTLSRTVCGVMRLRDWGLDTDGLRRFIHACLDLGVTTFDHADIYGDYQCEAIFGQALAAEPGLRDRMEIVTKCGIKLVSDRFPDHRIHHYDTSKNHIIASAERSLRNLHTDVLDVLLIHRPDPLMDADEVAEALTHLRQSGKVRHVGVSNFSPMQYELLASRLSFPLVTNQIELSALHMEPLHDGTMDHLQQIRVAPMAWSPLGGARLFTSDEARMQRVRQALSEVGEQVGGAGLDQVALAWLLRIPGNVLPVLGTGRLERIADAVAAEAITLDRRQWFAIWEASAGHEVP